MEADQDLDEAISLVNERGQLAASNAASDSQKLATRYATSDPEKAMRYAEEMVVQARAMDQPARAMYLAQAGALVVRLGNKEAGRKLVEEAADIVAKLGPGSQQDSTRAKVAEAMAPSDLARAVAILESITLPYSQDRYRADVALAGCLQDFDKALELVAQREPSSSSLYSPYSPYADSARLRMAYRLAPTRPADAVRVIETMAAQSTSSSGYAEETKAMALGWVATAVAPHDKSLAFSLIDQGLAILTAPRDRPVSISLYGGRPKKAAFLAVLANRIGYVRRLRRVASRRPFTGRQ